MSLSLNLCLDQYIPKQTQIWIAWLHLGNFITSSTFVTSGKNISRLHIVIIFNGSIIENQKGLETLAPEINQRKPGKFPTNLELSWKIVKSKGIVSEHFFMVKNFCLNWCYPWKKFYKISYQRALLHNEINIFFEISVSKYVLQTWCF